jgi:hypothetical protein
VTFERSLSPGFTLMPQKGFPTTGIEKFQESFGPPPFFWFFQ